MKTYTDKEIINGIINDNRKVYIYIYNKFLPMIERMVIKLGGRKEDAQDIFQEALLATCRKIKSGELTLCCKFSTYVYAVSRKIWIQELKSAEMKNIRYSNMENMVCEPEQENSEEVAILAIVDKHIENLSKDCRKILRLHFNRGSIKDIMKIMGYKNSHHTMDRKYRCKQSLVKRIMNDPDLKDLIDEYTRENRTLY